MEEEEEDIEEEGGIPRQYQRCEEQWKEELAYHIRMIIKLSYYIDPAAISYYFICLSDDSDDDNELVMKTHDVSDPVSFASNIYDDDAEEGPLIDRYKRNSSEQIK